MTNYELTVKRIERVKTHLRRMRMAEFKYDTWAWDYWSSVRNQLERQKKENLH